MPPKGMKYRELYLQCEWSTCKDIFTDSVDNFISHVKVHVQEFLSSQHDEGNERQASQECQWKDCDYVSSGSSNDLVKHTYFHAYHTKLKWYGLQEQTRCKLNPCQLDMQSRNLIPDLPERFQCDWHQCMYHVDNPEYFYRHVEMHAMTSEPIVLSDNSEGVVCRWGGCHTNCKNKYKLKEHLKSHTQEKMYGCCVCGGLFYNRTKYVDHLDRQLAVELQRFQCSHCSKTFSTERLLRDHMRHHVNHYKCPFCDMTCPAPSALNKHIRYRHLDEKLHRCDLCEYSCKSAYDLRRHIDSHNAALMLKCQVNDCSYKTKAIQSLRLHYKKVHHNEEARYLCHICDNSFSRGSLLTKHLKKKHKFKWPSGHPRFRYKLHDDGFYRLQTVRYESVELTEQLINEKQQSSHGSRQEEQTMVEHEQSGNSSDSGNMIHVQHSEQNINQQHNEHVHHSETPTDDPSSNVAASMQNLTQSHSIATAGHDDNVQHRRMEHDEHTHDPMMMQHPIDASGLRSIVQTYIEQNEVQSAHSSSQMREEQYNTQNIGHGSYQQSSDGNDPMFEQRIQHEHVEHNPPKRRKIEHSLPQHHNVEHNLTSLSNVEHSMMQLGDAQHNPTQHGGAQHNQLQHTGSNIQHNPHLSLLHEGQPQYQCVMIQENENRVENSDQHVHHISSNIEPENTDVSSDVGQHNVQYVYSGDVNSDSSESKDSTPCVQNSSKQSDSLTILANTAEKILLGIS